MFNDFGLMIAQYNSVLPTLSDAQYTELQVDANGRLLVQADVSVVIDFLGLNGASDSSNILVVGTEDGTAGGIAHALRVSSNGSLIIDSIANAVTVQATDLDIRDLDFNSDSVTAHQGGTWTIDSITNPVTVQATDLDIRDLNSATDSVTVVGEVSVAALGTEEFAGSDIAGDGLVEVPSTTFVDAASITVGAGESLYIYGWDFDADQNVTARLVVADAGVPAQFLKVKVNSTAMPGREEHYSESGRIEITGAADRSVIVQVAKRGAGGGTASASASIHARKLV